MIYRWRRKVPCRSQQSNLHYGNWESWLMILHLKDKGLIRRKIKVPQRLKSARRPKSPLLPKWPMSPSAPNAQRSIYFQRPECRKVHSRVPTPSLKAQVLKNPKYLKWKSEWQIVLRRHLNWFLIKSCNPLLRSIIQADVWSAFEPIRHRGYVATHHFPDRIYIDLIY